MQARRAARRNIRMLERAGLVFLHAEALHYRSRAPVARHGEGNDRVEAELVEAEAQCGACTFGCEPLAPVGPRESPADFHTGRARNLGWRRLQADEADELSARL